MTDIGIVGLDTSHPEKFASLVADRDDASVAAVWDGGTVRDEAYVEAFCERHDAERVAEPADMVGRVDAAMVLTVDWDDHARQADPFLRAGLPVLVDKPVAGSVADVERLAEAAAAGGAPLFGGSAVPFHPAFDALVGTDTRVAYGAGYNGPFYYGAHLTDTVRRVVGENWRRVAPAAEPGPTVDVTFEDAVATVNFDGGAENSSFAVLRIGEETCTARVPGTAEELARMYDPYLDRFLRAEGDDGDRLLDAARLLLATQVALDADREVRPDDAALADYRADSGPFVDEYEPYY